MWVFELSFLLFARESVAASLNAKELGVNLSLLLFLFQFFSLILTKTPQNIVRH